MQDCCLRILRRTIPYRVVIVCGILGHLYSYLGLSRGIMQAGPFLCRVGVFARDIRAKTRIFCYWPAFEKPFGKGRGSQMLKSSNPGKPHTRRITPLVCQRKAQ